MGGIMDPSSEWVGLVVKDSSLVQEQIKIAEPALFRAQLEEFQLPERIRQGVTDLNKEAGYQVLSLLDFMPPQRSVLRLSFSRKKSEYIMEIVVASNGPAVVFRSVTSATSAWHRYLHGHDCSLKSHVAFSQSFTPAKITNDTLRVWFVFLLSGFKRKFNPGRNPQSSGILPFDMRALLDKAFV